MTEGTLTKHFRYLDNLRDSGRTNMYGAALFLREECGVADDTSTRVVRLWMETFDGKTPLKERVQAALTSAMPRTT